MFEVSRSFVWAGVLWAAATATTASGQTPPADWLGQKVFVKETARPRVGNRVFEWNTVSLPATVSKVEGKFLWLGSAWVTPNEVVPVDDAPAYYTDVMARRPAEAWPYLLRAVAWHLKRDYANAIKDFSEAIRREPGVPMAHRARAQTYHAQGDYQRALDDLNEAIRLDPRMAIAYNDRGATYNELDEYQKAYEQLSEAIRLDPKLALAYYNRGSNWHDQRQYDKALADFNRAIELDPKMALASDGRGYTYSRMGHYGKAAKDFETSIKLAPHEPWGYLNFARMWATADSEGPLDGPRAVEAATKACELSNWADWICVAALAAAYAEAGDFAKAVEWQERAIKLDVRPEHKDKVNAAERLEIYRAGKPYREKAMPPLLPDDEEPVAQPAA
ncbi:MAG: tetratricopeptide repeat protein, partial [Planctomycetaceae bacterium]|nr:tetratricopeptide repeat protein [Planctomycetaceae bacterium]